MKRLLLLGKFVIGIQLVLLAGPGTTKNNIHVDQFGYRCTSQKVAVISSPQVGYNTATEAFSPGIGTNNYQVRRWSDDVVVFQGTLSSWKSGTTHGDSGDRVWWFDFSSVNTAGDYYIFDVSNNVGSYQFRIADDVYKEVLKHALRSFYYQRCGYAKVAPYAQTGYTDAASHMGPLQDTDCRLYNQRTNASTAKDLRGGWYDAGDFTKYVNFTWETLMDLLIAYEENPTAFTDDYSIPESGNGIPDILDEVKFELDWLLRMQQSDGSVLSIVGHGWGSPPSTDNSQAVYGPANTSSALSAAGIFALAAIQFKSLGIPAMTTYANTLQTAAVNALTWATANPNVIWRNNDAAYGSQGVGAGQQEVDNYGRQTRRIAANVFLYALTNTASYRTYVESNYNSGAEPIHLASWGYVYPFETAEQDMMLYFSKLPGVTTTVRNDIQNKYSNSLRTNADNYPNVTNQNDAYRAYLKDYTWGSCKTHAAFGNNYTNMFVYGMDASNATAYRNAAEDYVHYFHGVNPNAYVYLSNMNAFGAEKSVTSLYHGWFNDGSTNWDEVGISTYGPAPGFLVGGPNPTWSLDGCCPSGCGSPGNNALCVTLTPPGGGQPKMKAFRSFNANWPQNSWAVTENGIYYQAEYIKLLSKFVGGGTCGTLPVEWLQISAKSLNHSTQQILWSTVSETQSAYFEVERSEDGITFTTIQRIAAAGNSASIQYYQIQDAYTLNRTVYYRIRQVDLDGTFTYSSTLSLHPTDAFSLQVFPNPSKYNLTVRSNLPIQNITLLNALGQPLASWSVESDTYSVPVQDLPAGMYYLQCELGNSREVRAFVKE
ncbi:MAG: glycoside hydrolase family 9 protein [Cytophagaceae bacterium]|jgi:hypothetical protein|nr:glycoside hydrolase family 9 protein [Cytophagaceae bacterium]